MTAAESGAATAARRAAVRNGVRSRAAMPTASIDAAGLAQYSGDLVRLYVTLERLADLSQADQ